MQDNYVGDIGDYGKYGLLRTVDNVGLSLAVNWYNVVPKKDNKQNDGKYTSYLSLPQKYRNYDPPLFDALHKIVCCEQCRHIGRIEQEHLFNASFFSSEILSDRPQWHQQVVFLDPDNGLETQTMFHTGKATEKHVKWEELRDYYSRGQSVILYQHRPQMTKKNQCIDNILQFQKDYLCADTVKLLEFPKYTNRFYFMFVHAKHQAAFEYICFVMKRLWRKDDFSREIEIK